MLVQTAAEKCPGTSAHTRNPWFTALWQSWQNSNLHSHLQDKKHTHASVFYDSSGFLPLPGASDFSCRPAVHSPSVTCRFLRSLKHVFSFWKAQISLFGSRFLFLCRFRDVFESFWLEHALFLRLLPQQHVRNCWEFSGFGYCSIWQR